MAGRVTQAYIDVLVTQRTPYARATQAYLDVLVTGRSTARITQNYIEVLVVNHVASTASYGPRIQMMG